MAAYGGVWCWSCMRFHSLPPPTRMDPTGLGRLIKINGKRTPGGKKEKEKTTFAPIYHSPQTNLKFASKKKQKHARDRSPPFLQDHARTPSNQSDRAQSNPIQSNPIQYNPTEPNPFNQSQSLRDLPRPVLRRLQKVFNFLCPLRLHKPFLFGLGGALLLARYRPRDGPCDLTY